MVKTLSNEEIRELLRGKSVLDEKPSSHQDEKPSSQYVYPYKKTQRGEKRSSQPENQKTLVIKDESIRQGFAQVPNIVLRDPTLSGNEKTLYALLLSYAWQNNGI